LFIIYHKLGCCESVTSESAPGHNTPPGSRLFDVCPIAGPAIVETAAIDSIEIIASTKITIITITIINIFTATTRGSFVLCWERNIEGAGKFFSSFPAFFSPFFLKDPKP
jgi:hypothetical protein